ncbi:MAG: hypothetical protein GF418_03450 [Chitinivibrionales bacterium]|nr:hypothetical protein [Chitinivibrionales bacterium]MBD3394659.1 hypothetical protein [Chitinivibrionales bacterium]
MTGAASARAMPSVLRASACMLVMLAARAQAKLPTELPGEEITEEQYFDYVVPRDSIAKQIPEESPSSPTWLDSAAQTWDAPPLAVQMARDEEKLQMGMGAVFVPCMSDPDHEPDVEILDDKGEAVAAGKTGRKYSLVPGSYYVMLGSGPHKQRMVKKVEISDGKIVPIVPDWTGLRIDVVDESNQPFRGEYEITRIDEFEPYGRGYGRDPDLGQKLATWLLKPGVYKIFGVGQSYNTLTNFVTVRLLPGELVRFVLVQQEDDMTIIGGGMVETEARTGLASNWKYGMDIGGGIDFNSQIYHNEDSTDTKTGLDLLANARLKFERNKVDWETRFRLVQTILLQGLDFRDLESTDDDLRLSSIYTWRLLRWLGPYGRLETETEIVPDYKRRPETDSTYFFVLVDEDDTLTGIDSTSESIKLEPSFTPFTFEVGAGANIRLPRTRFFEGKILGGIGFRQRWSWDQSEVGDSVYADPGDPDLAVVQAKSTSDKVVIRQYEDASTQPEYGPETAMYATLRFGQFATTDTEIKVFAPFTRFTYPDFYARATLSWRLIRSITLVYEYEYELSQPEEETLKENLSTHRVLLRFSYTSR